MGAYLRPETLAEALDALAERSLTPLAGGTDLYPNQANLAAWNQAPDLDLIDLSALQELKGIGERAEAFRIGALATWTEVLEAGLPDWFEGLRLAAREVGGVQIQNRGTLAGNLCNASPAADGVPALLALDASVELMSKAGSRRLPLAAFVLGNRRTARRPDELVTSIEIPKPAAPARSTFLKLGARKYLVISIVMVAATLEVAEGRVAAARVAVGSCSAAARRLPALEAALAGRPCDATLAEAVTAERLAGLSPIDDARASAAYRGEAAVTLVRRALTALAGGGLERAA
ncbi:CO or xanthine dehydrogenase, FAD-binding subunit [Tistlia consotensis]|uniref:FAD binding domain-containing protein n=1 Tax=Tistlia consotensis TaxID=1321365 RepID=UPI000B6570B5|nr:xanthine dehydrogenase family protein subunit M [Tistlia consotensis]SNR40400.1 CO or xanthine dehydrogenase, FAD-binding subunit [Tistlia consotensis]